MKLAPGHLLLVLALFALGVASVPAGAEDDPPPTLAFGFVEVHLDSGDAALAAWQVEVQALGDVRIVGIEGGEHPVYAEAPYYDPDAIQKERVILAAFSTAAPDALPHGRTRVATIHLAWSGAEAPRFETNLSVAADEAGKAIDAADVTLVQGPDS
ncbi:MAG: hypothetical protein ACYTGP_02895 [Planctomycetota bacterium]|jgi:hypothetical protein